MLAVRSHEPSPCRQRARGIGSNPAGRQSKLLKNVFDKQELKRQRKRIRQIAEGNLAAKTAQDVIDGVRAAVMVALMMPAMVAVTADN